MAGACQATLLHFRVAQDDDESDRIGSLMRTALRHGGEHSTRPLPGSAPQRQGLQPFTGSARTLAGDERAPVSVGGHSGD